MASAVLNVQPCSCAGHAGREKALAAEKVLQEEAARRDAEEAKKKAEAAALLAKAQAQVQAAAKPWADGLEVVEVRNEDWNANAKALIKALQDKGVQRGQVLCSTLTSPHGSPLIAPPHMSMHPPHPEHAHTLPTPRTPCLLPARPACYCPLLSPPAPCICLLWQVVSISAHNNPGPASILAAHYSKALPAQGHVKRHLGKAIRQTRPHAKVMPR